MKYPLLLLLLTLRRLVVADRQITYSISPRIVGGSDANPSRYPYFTWLRMDKTTCAGSLIWEDIVLTAGHCLIPGATVTAFVNRTNRLETSDYEYERAVVDFRRHPDYTKSRFSVTERNDIMVYKLASRIDPDTGVKPLRLNTSPLPPSDGQLLTVMGLGRTSDGGQLATLLQDVEVNKIDFNDCNDGNSFNGEIIDEQMICAGVATGGKDACAGDSGAPLVLRGGDPSQDVQMGLVSFGEGCANVNFPGVYTRVSFYNDWIKASICEMSSHPPTGCPSSVTPHPTPPLRLPSTPSPVFSVPTTNVPSIHTGGVTTNPTAFSPSDTPSDPKLNQLCGDCFCIPQDSQCLTVRSGISQSFKTSTISQYDSFVATNVIRLQSSTGGDCYPFANAVGSQTSYPESKLPQCQLPTSKGVCAFVFESVGGGQMDTCKARRYSMQTFATESKVPANASITHQGPCGVCSSAQDLATRMKTLQTFHAEIATCQTVYSVLGKSFSALVSCLQQAGFTPDCATLWAHFAATELDVCSSKCQVISGEPSNGPAPECALPDCLQCSVETVARPCSSIYPVVHDPCAGVNTSPTPSPTPRPTGFCFSGESMVQVKDKGATRMANLKLGDHILVDQTGTFEPIYSFGHRLESQLAQFLRLHPSMLEVSNDHMVFVVNKGAIPASMVQVGDKLVGGAAVSSITKVTRRGIFAPFTPSGTLVVNGVVASSYVSFQESDVLKIGSIATPLRYQWLAHAFQVPHKIWCYYRAQCENEQSTERGVSTWVQIPLSCAHWILAQRPIVMVALIIPAVLLLTIFALVDVMLLNPFLFMSVFTLVALLRAMKPAVKFL
jgi:secreted trypsin-like serine protease